MGPDGVEVKVGLDSDQTAEAVRILGLTDVAPWRIFFAEDVTTGLCSATPASAASRRCSPTTRRS